MSNNVLREHLGLSSQVELGKAQQIHIAHKHRLFFHLRNKQLMPGWPPQPTEGICPSQQAQVPGPEHLVKQGGISWENTCVHKGLCLLTQLCTDLSSERRDNKSWQWFWIKSKSYSLSWYGKINILNNMQSYQLLWHYFFFSHSIRFNKSMKTSTKSNAQEMGFLDSVFL